MVVGSGLSLELLIGDGTVSANISTDAICQSRLLLPGKVGCCSSGGSRQINQYSSLIFSKTISNKQKQHYVAFSLDAFSTVATLLIDGHLCDGGSTKIAVSVIFEIQETLREKRRVSKPKTNFDRAMCGCQYQ